MVLSACLNCFDHLKVHFERGAKMDLKRKCLKCDPNLKRNGRNVNYVIDWAEFQNERASDTYSGMDETLEKWDRTLVKSTTLFALPQALKRPSGLAFSSHRFTKTQEGGNNTHFPSFCFPRDMFFFYILSSFLSFIFCLLLLWVASLSLIHNEQEDTLSPERKTQDEREKKKDREEENEDRKNEGGWKANWTSFIFLMLQMLNGLKRRR